MNDTSTDLLALARDHVTNIFLHNVSPDFVFHNLEHTEDVVEACSKMAEHYQLTDNDRLILLIAAWFHDTGYSSGETQNHETESIKLATQFLTQHGSDENMIQKVASCIEATRMPQSPVTLIEKILCDADLFHLSTEDFKARSQLLKQERELTIGIKIPNKEWRKGNVSFLKNHKYFTDYGTDSLEPKKLVNLQSLLRKGKKKGAADNKGDNFPYMYPTAQAKEAQREEQKGIERGVQTMFRTASSNHIRLSGMSDSKAHILISVNSIIISVILTVSVRQHIPYITQFMYPIGLLVIICLVTIVFAILATRPSVTSGVFTEEDIRSKKTNLLFFGNFYKMELDNYIWAMNQMMKDGEYLYNNMIKDIYFLGVVLARKYRYLRISYTVFMWGLIASVVAFIIAAIIAMSSPEALPVIDYK